MSRYEDAFEYLAEEGTPIGATAMVMRVRDELVDEPAPQRLERRLETSARRWVRGPAAALVAFVLVIVVGGIWLAFGGSGGAPGGAPAVEWRLMPDLGEEGWLSGGPGGFVYVARSSGASEAFFSSDGIEWQEIKLPSSETYSFIAQVTATDELWMAVARDNAGNSVVFTSHDGQSWTRNDLPAELERRLPSVLPGTGRTFLATAWDRAGGDRDLWLTDNAVSWRRLETQGLDSEQLAGVFAGSAGFVAWGLLTEDDQPPDIYVSDNGEKWTEALIPTVAEYRSWMPFAAYGLGDRWVLLAVGWDADTDIGAQVIAWVSDGGDTWELQNPTGIGAASLWPIGVADGTLVIVSDEPGGARAWSTTDGVTWQPGRFFEPGFLDGAITELASGPVAVWQPSSAAKDSSIVPTTMPTIPTAELDQAGLDLQQRILSDSNVTVEEFREAVESLVSCMDTRGVAVSEWSVDDDGGGWSMGYDANDEAKTESVYNTCYQSYLAQIDGRAHL